MLVKSQHFIYQVANWKLKILINGWMYCTHVVLTLLFIGTAIEWLLREEWQKRAWERSSKPCPLTSHLHASDQSLREDDRIIRSSVLESILEIEDAVWQSHLFRKTWQTPYLSFESGQPKYNFEKWCNTVKQYKALFFVWWYRLSPMNLIILIVFYQKGYYITEDNKTSQIEIKDTHWNKPCNILYNGAIDLVVVNIVIKDSGNTNLYIDIQYDVCF